MKGEIGVVVNQIICKGLDYLGTPYQFDAPSYQSKTFDCSSFVQYLYGMYGIQLPRNSRQQFLKGKSVRYKNRRKGDLLFFTTRDRKNKEGLSKIGHVAIYIGNDLMLHTKRNGKGVTIEKINRYWKNALIGVKRVIHQRTRREIK